MSQDKIISNALQFWYTEDHDLYGDPLPALLGIVGESGELADLWKKKLYKPGFVFDRDAFIDELGDCLFYAAILCHYTDFNLRTTIRASIPIDIDVTRVIVLLNYAASQLTWNFINDMKESHENIVRIMLSLYNLAVHFDVTLDELSEMNYAKLNERAANGEGYNRGEERECICNRADDCDIKCPHKVLHNSDDFDDCFDPGCVLSGLSDAVCVPVKCSE